MATKVPQTTISMFLICQEKKKFDFEMKGWVERFKSLSDHIITSGASVIKLFTAVSYDFSK